jgi:hypothetical protein
MLGLTERLATNLIHASSDRRLTSKQESQTELYLPRGIRVFNSRYGPKKSRPRSRTFTISAIYKDEVAVIEYIENLNPALDAKPLAQ